MKTNTIALLSPAVGSGNVGDSFIEEAIRRLLHPSSTFLRFSIRRELRAEELDAINACAAAIICGTNLYQHDWHSALTPEILSRLTVPVIPFGVGSSAANLEQREVSQTTRRMIRAFHERCALGSVRDPHSLEVVQAAGVNNAILTGCPVLYSAGGEELPAIRPVRRSRVILTARNWLMHRWPDAVDHPVQLKFLRTLLDRLPRQELRFAIHEEFDERLIDLLNIPPEIVIRSSNVQEYLALYSDPGSVVVAMRLHAGMLALANGVPAIFVGHDTRTYSFCQMMGLDYIQLFAEEAAHSCLKRIQAVLAGDLIAFEHLPARFRELRVQMLLFMEANGLPALHSATV